YKMIIYTISFTYFFGFFWFRFICYHVFHSFLRPDIPYILFQILTYFVYLTSYLPNLLSCHFCTTSPKPLAGLSIFSRLPSFTRYNASSLTSIVALLCFIA